MKEIVGYEVGPQQQRLWARQQWTAALGTHAAVLVEGNLALAQLQQSVNCVVARHEMLRTSFESLAAMQAPLQVINAQGGVTITELDLSATGGAELPQLIEQWRREAFELKEQALRVALVRLAKEQHVLRLSLSPLCGDVSSLKNVLAEICEHCGTGKLTRRDEEVVQYAQFSQWQREIQSSAAKEDEQGREYWRQCTASLPEAIELSGENRASAGASFSIECVRVTLEETLGVAAQRLADSRRVPLTTVLMAAWQVLLFRLSGAEQLLVMHGSPARKYEELQSAVGQYMTWLPVRAELTGTEKFSEMLSRLHAIRASHAKQQEYFNPELLHSSTEEKPGIGYSHEEWPSACETETLKFTPLWLSGHSEPLKLHLQSWQNETAVQLEFWYEQHHYREQLVQRLAEQYQTLLREAVAAVETRVKDLSLLSASERTMVLEFGQGRTTTSLPELSLHEHFEQQVERTPAALAVCFGEECLTYEELNRRANQLAHYLRESGCEPGARVGLMLDRGIEMIVAVLGVLKSGGAYVPLDPGNPAPRLSFMLEDAMPALVLTQSHLYDRLANRSNIVCIDAQAAQIAQQPDENPGMAVDPLNLAYVLYTSGSTGRPKGVAVAQGSVVNLVRALQRRIYDTLPPAQRVAMNAPLTFDASVKQLFQLMQGHTLLPVPEELRLESRELVSWCSGQQIDVLDTTPSHLRLFLDAGLLSATPGPRVLLIGGEPIDRELWETLQGQSRMACYNVYGPTECTVDTTVMAITEGSAPALGRAIDNVSVYVLDQRNEPVAIGETGEICVAGVGLARGYFNQPEATAERFVPHPFAPTAGARLYRTGDLGRWQVEGTLEYVGRADFEVKLRGLRIQPGEIEAALMKHAGIRECVVQANGQDAAERQLVAYVVPQRHSAEANGSFYGLANGLTIRQHNSNETAYLYEEIFEKECYTRHGITLSEDACVLDVGANIGLFTLFTSERCPRGQIYAFEPIAPLCETLRLNSGLSKAPVRIFQHGLGSAERVERFSYYPRYTMMSGLSAYADEKADVEVIERYLANEAALGIAGADELVEHSAELLTERFVVEEQECRLRRLTDVLREEGIGRVDLLKIDVQRAEMEVLEGLSEADWENIRQVVLEVHDEAEGHGRVAEINALLMRHGYEVIAEQDELLKGTDRWNVYAKRLMKQPATRNGKERAEQTGRRDNTTPRLELTGKELRRHLERLLPEHMIPSAFVTLDAIPLNASGKVDRQALAQHQPSSVADDEAVGYHTPAEEMVAALWSDLLQTNTIRRDDNFFELGGHSLLATQVISRLREMFGVEIGLRRLFEDPTVRGLARTIEELKAGHGLAAASQWSPLVRIQPGASSTILFGIHGIEGAVMHYVRLARSMGREQTFYALQAKGSETEDTPHTDLQTMASYYIDVIREVQPAGPYCLTGYSFGGHVAFEMAQQLLARGESVGQLILLDTYRKFFRHLPEGEFNDAVYWCWWFGTGMNLTPEQIRELYDKLSVLDSEQQIDEMARLLKLSGEDQYNIPHNRLRQKLRVQKSSSHALCTYKPKVYPAQITLLRAQKSHDPSPDLGWQELAGGGIEIHWIPGDHHSSMKNPNVNFVGDVLKRCLANAVTK